MNKRDAVLFFVAAALLLPMQPAQAQAYPIKPIRIVVPNTPGGTLDFAARLFAERLRAPLGQPVLVENRPGASTLVGTDFVSKQPPDGYTLLIAGDSLATLPALQAKLPFDPIKDITPISPMATPPFILVVNASLPFKTVNEYIAAARDKPGSITFGTTGVGSPFHFSGELLRTMANINILPVPYKGSGPITQALLAGEVDSTFSPLTLLMPYIRSGKLRPLAAMGSKRNSFLPDLPTMAEAVPLPGYAMEAWIGIFGPGGMPRPIVDRLNGEIRRIVQDPKFVKEKLMPVGLEPMEATPDQIQERVKVDIAKYLMLAKNAGIKPE
jgi:tripartite-type tricarboxylate transporter receptor subunit TctC